VIVVSALPSELASEESRRDDFLLLTRVSSEERRPERREEREKREEREEREERTEPRSLSSSPDFPLRRLPRDFLSVEERRVTLTFSGVCTGAGPSSVSSRQFAMAKVMGVHPFRSCTLMARWITCSFCWASASTSRARIGSETKTDA
jgi:hypothetical protein